MSPPGREQRVGKIVKEELDLGTDSYWVLMLIRMFAERLTGGDLIRVMEAIEGLGKGRMGRTLWYEGCEV